jgi:outer membrane protein assembly factor BamD (BamD/ComL family)
MMRSIRLSPIRWLGFAIGGGFIGLFAFFLGNNLIDQAYYDKGVQAYQEGNCDRSQSELNTFLKRTGANESDEQTVRAKAIQTECNLLQSVLTQQKSGQLPIALSTSAEFAQRYPQSPLMDFLRQNMIALFAKNRVDALAKPTSCKRFENLIKENLVPESNQPDFYQACGKVLADSGQYHHAIALYEKFLDQFSKHALIKKMKQAYAQALYAEAQVKGAGNIPPPIQGGTTGDGSTVVEVRNDSPEKMRIVFGGPTPRVEELEPCKDCQTYSNPPSACPNKGPVGNYTVDSGQYRIIVKSIATHKVTPYTGDWSLTQNTLYTSCFFIVHRPI